MDRPEQDEGNADGTTVFFSYSRKDRDRAIPIIQAIEAAGYSVWWDGMLEGGTNFLETTEHALESAKAVVVLWSRESVGSHWVRDEATSGRERSRIVPLSLDGSMAPLGFRQVQLIDMRNWHRRPDAFDDVLRCLAKLHDTEFDPPDRRTTMASPPPPGSGLSRRTAILGGLGLGAAGAAGVLGTQWWQRRNFGSVSETSVAVLPFTNEVGSDEFDYLATGLSSAIRDGLARNEAMQVMARSSSQAALADGLTHREMVSRLGVGSILEGRLHRLGLTIELTTTLTDARTGFARWVETQAYVTEQALELRDAIIRTVSTELSTTVQAAAPGAATLPQAFDEYMKGETLLVSRGSMEGLQQARRHFETAAALDPTYADPVTALAEVYLILGAWGSDVGATRTLFDQAERSAEAAVAMTPNDAYVHTVLGYVRVLARLDYRGAAAPFDRAKELGLNSSRSLQRYAIYRISTGQPDAAIEAMRQARTLDPLDTGVIDGLAFSYYAAGDYKQAANTFRQVLEIDPNRYLVRARLGLSLLFDGDVEAGLAACAKEDNVLERLPCEAFGAVRQGNMAAAQSALDELISLYGDAGAYQQVQILTQMGRIDDALDALRLAEELSDSGLTLLRIDPALEPLRDRPEYQALLVRLGLDR